MTDNVVSLHIDTQITGLRDHLDVMRRLNEAYPLPELDLAMRQLAATIGTLEGAATASRHPRVKPRWRGGYWF